MCFTFKITLFSFIPCFFCYILQVLAFNIPLQVSEDVCPPEVVVVPSGQEVQLGASGASEKVPTGHSVQNRSGPGL